MKYLYTKKLILFVVDKDMATLYRQRADQVQKLVLTSKNQAAIKNKKITTVDPIFKVGKAMYPTLSYREIMELSQTALRIILNEGAAPTYQTSLLSHL